jgi:hypothetical protein
LNTRFLLRGLALALPLAIAATVVALLVLRVRAVLGPPPDPTPLPPTILAPRGDLPQATVAFQEWVRYRGESAAMVGCGFLLQVADGQVVGVTTAHSAPPGNPNHPLEWITLLAAQPAGYALPFDTLHGPPGRPRTGDDLTMDYVLLHPGGVVEPAYVLQADPRGAPQPGERASLYRCMGGDAGGQHISEGTVQSVADTAVWVLMDEPFTPAGWSGSGSPLISQHSGKVVGMLIAGTLRGRWLLLGMHPIGSLVQKSEAAAEFPRMANYVAGATPAVSTSAPSATPSPSFQVQ